MLCFDGTTYASWPDLFRPSTSLFVLAPPTWMSATQAARADAILRTATRAGMTIQSKQKPALTAQQPINDPRAHQKRQNRYPHQERTHDRQQDDPGRKADREHDHGE